MLNLKKVLAAKPKEHVVSELHPLLTPWGETLDTSHVLEEHPTPQFARETFSVLNGRWWCVFTPSEHAPTDDLEQVVREAMQPYAQAFDQDIIVPFSPEASLSGVGRVLQPDELLWYRRLFEAPVLEEGQRLLLHFQAVDYACSVRINGTPVGTHVGGYLPFSFDITDVLQAGTNELIVCVADPSEFGGRLRGKQRVDRGDIWYSAQSGIWQTVWMETVPAAHIVSAKIEPDVATSTLTVRLQLQREVDVVDDVRVEVLDDDKLVAMARCQAQDLQAISVHVPNVRLWRPDDPHLYTVRLYFGADIVESYCGFRSVDVHSDLSGHVRIFLNGQPFFVRGVLDQGYWPDGLMTAPSDEALIFDIEAMRDAGFNCLRKHVKVESERWYYHCDRLGMLVWQDMVSGGAANLNDWLISYKPTLFKSSWDRYSDIASGHWEKLGAGSVEYRKEWREACVNEIKALSNHPCILAWTLFNEGWGQFESAAACEAARAADPTRPICATSGWYDQGAGDIRGVHNYFRDFAVWKRGLNGRAFVVTEFGGFAHRVNGHSSLDQVYGYEVYGTVEGWQNSTRALLAEVEALEPRGLAGFVFTQLSDIEEEANGILTYDRRINKLHHSTPALPEAREPLDVPGEFD